MSPSVDDLRQLLALLRAQLFVYQDAHWQVAGPQFYGDHLLFERLYNSVGEQIDTLAEKMVAMFGPSSVDAEMLVSLTMGWVRRWSPEKDFHRRGLLAEQECLVALERTYRRLREAKSLSLGMDDFLMATVNDHEQNLYLLQQTQRP